MKPSSLLILLPASGSSTRRTSSPTGRPKLSIILALLGSVLILGGIVYAAFTIVASGTFRPYSAIVRTNVPEVAMYVDVFNASQSRFRLELVYDSTPAKSLRDQEPSDLVIGSGLTHARAFERLRSLDRLFKEGNLKESSFYEGALRLGKREGRIFLVPISFDIPGIMFLADDVSYPPFMLTLEELRTRASGFNVTGSNGFTRMGFSLRWDRDFLSLLAGLTGTSFRENGEGLAWDPYALVETVKHARDWIVTDNGGLEEGDHFREKYLYDPPYKLLRDRRILFSLTKASSFVAMPEENRSHLEYRWLASGDRIPVSDRMVYAGIPRNARHRQAAEEFLLWLFNVDTQRSLLEISRLRQVRSFGIAGGFSSIVEVTESIFPRSYPFLIGHIPPQSFFAFPALLPPDWQTLKTEVLEPWLSSVVSDDSSLSDLSSSLSQRVATWRRQNGGF